MRRMNTRMNPSMNTRMITRLGKRMREISVGVCLALALLLCGLPVGAVELGTSPVNDAMQQAMYDYAWHAGSDEQWPGQSAPPTALESRDADGRKSMFKSVALSLLVPGGGQYYIGHKKTAYYFFAAEALTWVGYASFKVYGNWKEDDYIRYAAVHANAQLDGKSKDFVDLVAFYQDIYEYNSLARAFDPDRPYLTDTPENHWVWQSDAERQAFRDLKNRSREADRRADFMIGVAVVDRIISVIDAVRATRKHNRQMPSEFSSDNGLHYKFAVHPFSSTRQFSFTVYPNF